MLIYESGCAECEAHLGCPGVSCSHRRLPLRICDRCGTPVIFGGDPPTADIRTRKTFFSTASSDVQVENEAFEEYEENAEYEEPNRADKHITEQAKVPSNREVEITDYGESDPDRFEFTNGEYYGRELCERCRALIEKRQATVKSNAREPKAKPSQKKSLRRPSACREYHG